MSTGEFSYPSRRSESRPHFLSSIKRILTPSRPAWQGAAWSVLIGFVAILTLSAGWMLLPAGPERAGVGVLVALAAAAAAAALGALLLALLGRLPFFFLFSLTGALVVTAVLGLIGLVYLMGIGIISAALIIGLALAGAGANGLRNPVDDIRQFPGSLRPAFSLMWLVLGLGLIGLAGAWLIYPGTGLTRPPGGRADQAVTPISGLSDPSKAGDFPVKDLCYGSADGRRTEPCLERLDLTTQPVDGSAFVEGWSSLRRSYWGFGPESMPLNARVWSPQGQGPFPLILILHGNALMEQPSHGGYAYLGELLASRGYITASVDENFLNLSFFSDAFVFNGLKKENDARAWLLLEHLRQWQEWNSDPASPFFGQVNLDQIGLIGHSRGGEAVAIAAAFNRMSHYPDDARVTFDYGYNIRAVAAIAPVDGQYTPGGVKNRLQDINYLALHGAHDMDVVTFLAARQYERVHFSETASSTDFYFKAGVYVDGANHGQFNTRWGRKDFSEPLARFFNLPQLMPAQDQQQIARVYLSAFLETALRGETGYLPLFRDARTASAWLPEGIYLSQYSDTITRLISDYEEDVDPATAGLEGGVFEGKDLSVWQEKHIPARWQSTDNRAVYLGWHDRRDGEEPGYALHLPTGFKSQPGDVLAFSLSGTQEDPCRDDDCREARQEPYQAPALFDLTLEVVDEDGQAARLLLSSFAVLHAPLETNLIKPPFKLAISQSEIVLQHYEFPLGAFQQANPQFNPEKLSSINWIFDQSPEGVVVLDHLSIRQEE
jgi:hypothetical protein